MIYIPIFVNIVLLLLFDYRYLSFSLFSSPPVRCPGAKRRLAQRTVTVQCLSLRRKTKHRIHERTLYRSAATLFQRLHDRRLVRPLEIQRDANRQSAAALRCHSDELGHRLLRILLPGAGQPHRLHRQRRPLLALPAEGDPGGGFAGRLHGLRPAGLQKRNVALEPSGGFHLPDPRRLLRLQEVRRIRFHPQAEPDPVGRFRLFAYICPCTIKPLPS